MGAFQHAMRKVITAALAAALLTTLVPELAATSRGADQALPAEPAAVEIAAPDAAVTRVEAVPRGAAATATCTNTVGPSIAPPPASSLVVGMSGYRAQFYGQSGYPTLCPGATATATIAFHNTISHGWIKTNATALLGPLNYDSDQSTHS